LRDDPGVAVRDVEVIATRESGIEAAPAVKAITVHEEHTGACGFLAGATDQRIENFAERSGAAERPDSFGEPSGCAVAFRRRRIGASDGRSIGFGAGDGCLLRLGASDRGLLGLSARDVGFAASGVDFGASGIDVRASAVGFRASGIGLSASRVGFGASDRRQLVADDAGLAGDLVANLRGDLVAETVGKSIKSSLELFIKGHGGC
jgi:hypothetical protein